MQQPHQRPPEPAAITSTADDDHDDHEPATTSPSTVATQPLDADEREHQAQLDAHAQQRPRHADDEPLEVARAPLTPLRPRVSSSTTCTTDDRRNMRSTYAAAFSDATAARSATPPAHPDRP